MKKRGTDYNGRLVTLIYETAEEIELWPKLLDVCKRELLEIESLSATELATGSPSKEDSSTHDNQLLTHLQRAFRINSSVIKMREEVDAARKILDQLPMAVVSVNSLARVTEKNRLAEKILTSSGILCERDGFLRAVCARDAEHLQRFIKTAFSTNSASSANVSLKLEKKNIPGSVSVYAVPPSNGQIDVTCTLLIVTNLWSRDALPHHIQEIYKLTPAEARLTHMLVAGNSLNEIAAQLSVSLNTVRNQLKSVFSKTGTHRQAELVSLILSMPVSHDSVNRIPDSNGEVTQNGEAEVSRRTLRDGRLLEYREFGDFLGYPVFYMHDAVAWDWWNLFPPARLASLGVRFIVPSRPGYHGSCFGPSSTLDTWAADLEELADHLGLRCFSLMGFSAGGVYAAAGAYHLKTRCVGLGLVSSFAPLDSLDDLVNIRPAMSRMILGFAWAAPKLYARFFRSLIRTVRADPRNYIKRYISRWSAYDRDRLDDDKVLESINNSFIKATDRGIHGLANEGVLLSSAWGFQIADIDVPTFLWYGEDDRASPENLVGKLFQIPNIIVRKRAGGGHLIVLDVWQEVLQTLVQQGVVADEV